MAWVTVDTKNLIEDLQFFAVNLLLNKKND
jgi:hypothetical protein